MKKESMLTVVSTKKKPSLSDIKRAKEISQKLNLPYLKRGKLTLNQLFEKAREIFKQEKIRILLVENQNLKLITPSKQELYFHPGLLKIRFLNILKKEKFNINSKDDLFYQVLSLRPGDLVLDCNLGLCQDALLCVYKTKSMLVGLEIDKVIALVVRDGLKKYNFTGKMKIFNTLKNLIYPICIDNKTYLQMAKDNSFDVVYFSPMFINPKWICSQMMPLREIAIKSFPDKDTLENAKRVARKRVVIKINKGAHELFDYLDDFQIVKTQTRLEYLIWTKK
ncbi:MAG TPA: hypothetical protein EYP03_06220 [Aquificae bacterium]|nr:hypothetical protein [Aquificota bacterium]